MESNQIKSKVGFWWKEKNGVCKEIKSQSRVDDKQAAAQPTSEILEEVKSYVFKLSGL